MFAAEGYERTPWGAILVAIGVLIGSVITKVSELFTIWYRARTDAQVALIKAQAEAKAADNRDCERLRADLEALRAEVRSGRAS